jgi:predicted hotdog family 3-hydroxylacyl-ACP dehydratase
MASPHPLIADLVAHRAPMLLLDEVVAWDGEALTAGLVIRPDSLFREAEGVPGHIGIEYMAQACAAFAGAQARAAGEPVRIGFLLGARNYVVHRPWFRLGDALRVTTRLLYRDEAMGMFEAAITVAGEPAGEAQLTVYHPSQDALPSGEPG